MADNSIELRGKETDTVYLFRLFRVMGIRHMEKPDRQASHLAYLRLVGSAAEPEVVVPDVLYDVIRTAFDENEFVLASYYRDVLEAAIILRKPKVFDARGYINSPIDK